MAIEVKLPFLGEGIDSADILKVLVSEGETIQKDQDIVEIETDKATAEVPSTHAGTVTKVLVSPGQTAAVGVPLIALESTGADAAPTPQPTEPQTAAPDRTPAAAATSPPDSVEPGTERATLEPSPGPEVTPSAPPPAAAQAVRPPPTDIEEPLGGAPAGPAIRRLAREVGIQLATIAGTGPGGRILRQDVLKAVREANAPAPAGTVAPVSDISDVPDAGVPGGQQSSDAYGPIRVERMSRIRRTIAAKMHKSWTTIPRVTNFDDADVTELEQVREKSKRDYAAVGIKLTAMPFIIKSVAMSLKIHPVMNASIDIDGGQVIYKQYVNIGIAVDTERGLVVPSLRDADKMVIAEIARSLARIAENARTNNFAVEDLRGSTFTISNLGAIGGSYSTPIIHSPEVAILLVGRSRKVPLVVENQIAVRTLMPLSLSYDHRLVDGAEAARFLNHVTSYLGAPSRLLLAP